MVIMIALMSLAMFAFVLKAGVALAGAPAHEVFKPEHALIRIFAEQEIVSLPKAEPVVPVVPVVLVALVDPVVLVREVEVCLLALRNGFVRLGVFVMLMV